MSSFWKTLRDSAREAAGEYRKLAEQHRQELSTARQHLHDENTRNLEDLHGAIQRAALYSDTEQMHAEMEASLRRNLLRSVKQAERPRAEAVLSRLQTARSADAPPVSVLVLIDSDPLAFVGFGTTIYLTTGMLERLPSDDALAFVLAHEVTHIDKGDNRIVATLAANLPVLPETLPLQKGLGLLVRTWMSPQRELAADRGGLLLATHAGYAPEGFEAVFDALAEAAIEKQLGVLVERDLGRWGEFWAQKLTGYPTIRERQSRLRAELQSG